MNIEALHQQEERRQHEFPVAREQIYLAHGGVSPLPRRVADAMQKYITDSTLGDQETVMPPSFIQHSRESVARLLQAQPDEVAFVGPTSLGLSYIASGLSFRKNDNILVYFDDYPSNVYPWMALSDKGVEVRFLNARELGLIRPKDVLGQVDEQTRLVALASSHYITGYRIDLDEIGSALRKRGILFCVDGIQTLGAFPTTVENIDFLAADAHKWLLGPCAAGILYVKRSAQDRLQPPIYGWHNVRNPNYITQEDIVFRQGPSRYEVGTHNLVGLVGLNAAVELLLEYGIANITAELLRKRAWFVPELEQRGFQVVFNNVPVQNQGGAIACTHPGKNLVELHGKLLSAGIITSLRHHRDNKKFLRFTPHFYNTDAELKRVLEVLS